MSALGRDPAWPAPDLSNPASSLQAALQDVSASALVGTEVNTLDMAALETSGDARLPVLDLVNILNSPAGILNAQVDAVTRAAQCPHCDGKYGTIRDTSTPAAVTVHLAKCGKDVVKKQCRVAIHAALKGKPCLHRDCGRSVLFEDDLADFEAHIVRHKRNLAGKAP